MVRAVAAVFRATRRSGFRDRDRDRPGQWISLDGPRTVRLPFRHLGADPAAGPNHTGEPAVASRYAPVPVAGTASAQ